jgi:hypothetical protein
VGHTFNLSTQEAETEGLWLQSKTLIQKTKVTKQIIKAALSLRLDTS